MIWGPGAVIGIALYLLLLSADVALIIFCFRAGRHVRWLSPLAFGINTLPFALFVAGLFSTLEALRTNADAAIALVFLCVTAAPFVVCFVLSGVAWLFRRRPAGSETH